MTEPGGEPVKGPTVAEARARRASQATPTPGRPPGRRKYLILFGVLAVLAVGAIAVAANSDPTDVATPLDVHHLPVGPAVPAVSAAEGWINSKPLSPAALRGKVVLYDFWTYSCVNCVRAIPHVRALYDRYARDGLVVVGIHSPEFDFEKDHANVRAAVKRLGVDYPVALDDDMAIWTAFENQYWPAHYIADRTGHLRAAGVGEGNYAETENVVRALLGVKASAPRDAGRRGQGWNAADAAGAGDARDVPRSRAGDRRCATGGNDVPAGRFDGARPAGPGRAVVRRRPRRREHGGGCIHRHPLPRAGSEPGARQRR